jgi:hypothetical protein
MNVSIPVVTPAGLKPGSRVFEQRRWIPRLRLRGMTILGALCVLSFRLSGAADDAAVLKSLQLLNQVPEEQLNEKVDPGFSVLRTLYDQDGPDFLTLRRLLGKAEIRSRLDPSAKCVLAGVISQRWDTFTLSGNLYLAGLRSANPDLRDKARRKLVCFIQPAHIPALIDLLKIPGPNVLAYEILQEVTGLHTDPSLKAWQKWWAKGGSKADIVGHVLNDTRSQLQNNGVHAFDQERFWYLPEGLRDSQIPYAKRPERDQVKISGWSNWVNTDVKRYVDDWSTYKPILDRIVHQPDPRVNKYLETLTLDPGYGDYASVVLAWRSSAGSLETIQTSFKSTPTVGRALARGSLGDKAALVDLLRLLEKHQTDPLSYKIMDDDARTLLTTLRTVGVIPAEQAFELLCHHNFDFDAAFTAKEKKKAYKQAKAWLTKNAAQLTLDRRRGYYVVSSEK